MNEFNLICARCNLELVPKRTEFNYLGHHFATEVPCCPKCGEAFISEELVRGRMAEVEMELEDK